ncbi:MAG: hypothetical protein R3183_11065 [Oleiphilaceae bacterium]|nr:hypothetical protein [Oleiphilaceae bacterium]
MSWQLILNKQVILEGDYKSLSVLFDCLSGLHFARNPRASWLDKMTAGESYQHYLSIKAKELGVQWQGTLVLCSPRRRIERAHIFDQHSNLVIHKSVSDNTGNVG